MSTLCTICAKKPAMPEYKPFCSKRCADIDLGRWLKGGYAIPTHEPAPVESLGEPADILPYRSSDD